jgi:hypothetical protein
MSRDGKLEFVWDIERRERRTRLFFAACFFVLMLTIAGGMLYVALTDTDNTPAEKTNASD